MKKLDITTSAIAIALWFTSLTAFAQDKKETRVEEATVTALLKNYSNTSQEVAEKMIKQYGQPHEATASMLIWHNNGPWKRTVLYSEEVAHHFPMPHKDVLEQFVDLDVDPKHYTALAEYDGSVVLKRTEGEISARCDKEPMNILALNLAHDIIEGKKTVEEAREFYAKTAARAMKGDMDPYTQKLNFQPDNSAGFKDGPAVGDVMKGMVGGEEKK